MKLRVVAAGQVVGLSADVVRRWAIDEDGSFLDGDLLVVAHSTTSNLWHESVLYGDGRLHLRSEKMSDAVLDHLNFRREEVARLLERGGCVVSLLSPVQYCRLEQGGRKEFTNISNYWMLPWDFGVVEKLVAPGGGTRIMPTAHAKRHPLRDVVGLLGTSGAHSVYLRGLPERGTVLAEIASGLPVLAHVPWGSGHVIFAGAPAGKEQAGRYWSALVGGVNQLLRRPSQTPVPDWALSVPVVGASELQAAVLAAREERDRAELRLTEATAACEAREAFRGLLFGGGAELEEVVRRAMRMFGFVVQHRVEAHREHDAVLRSEEGVAVVEMEGKEKSPIALEKLSQLSREVDEHVMDTGDSAVGVMVGNGFHTSPPDTRSEEFTDRARRFAAERGFVLARSRDLYEAVMRLLAAADPESYARRVRIALLRRGTQFSPPSEEFENDGA